METTTTKPAAVKPATCFHYFAKLPAELRLIIWKMAFSPIDDTPKLHYYSLFNVDEDGRRHSLVRDIMPRQTASSDAWHQPLWSDTSNMSWTKANRFEYFWDEGLRNACFDSRAVYLPHLEVLANREKLLDIRKNKPSHNSCVTKVKTNGSDAQLRIQPRRDIICIRVAPEDMSVCVHEDWWRSLLMRLPFIHLPETHNLNLAIEFDDSWADGLIEPDFDMATAKRRGSSWYGEKLANPSDPLSDTQKHCLGEASSRGLAMRAFWAWSQGLLPSRARMWLVSLSGRFTHPTIYYGDSYDARYSSYDGTYKEQPRPRPLWNYVCSDGRHRYIESYDWEGQEQAEYEYHNLDNNVPVLKFIWILQYCYVPADMWHHDPNEHFFRVLRQLPGPDDSRMRETWPGRTKDAWSLIPN